MSAPTQTSRPRLRFRLSTVLLLVAIIALGIAPVVTTRRIVQTEARIGSSKR